MPVAAAWILVALVGVLVGFAVPVLFQLRKTLKAAEETLVTTGARVNQALDELTVTLTRVNRAAEELEGGMGRVKNLLTALGGIGDWIVKFKSTFSTVASVGSIVSGAVLAAMGLARRARSEPAPEPRPEPETQPEIETAKK
jgi:uncharacterized protein YoxC